MTEITILRALNEISLLNKRIDKVLSQSGNFISFTIGGKAPVGFNSVKEVEDDIKARYQKINDLITRRVALKAAIVASNATTMIMINDTMMTVAAAIEYKSSIDLNQRLLRNLTDSSAQVNRKVESHNEQIEKQVQHHIESILGGKNSKVDPKEAEAISVPFKASKVAALVDPLNIKKVIDKIEDSVSFFERNVDSILTESNATTKITVPDNTEYNIFADH